MARMQNQTVIITVMMMLRLHSALTDQSLECYNDYYNTFTCVLNTSNVQPPITPQTNCSLHVEVKKRSSITETQQMSIKGSDLNIRTASVEFKKPGGIIIGAAIISEKVLCENFDAPVSQTQHRGDDSVVKVLPPVGVKVDGLNVSWSFASPKSTYFPGHVFELQYRSAEQSWTDSKSVQINDPYKQLDENQTYLRQPYVLRVRAKLLNKPNAIWSEWSSEYSWISDSWVPVRLCRVRVKTKSLNIKSESKSESKRVRVGLKSEFLQILPVAYTPFQTQFSKPHTQNAK
nr:interleukin-21 receptor-like isoform X2 [Misgurnus anguillicaudatus]